MFKKNTAVTGFTFGLVNASDGSAITTGTVSGFFTLDGGTQASIAGTPVHEGNGQWSVNLLAAEMNGDIVGLQFTHASAIPVSFTIKTETKLVSELQDLTAAQVNAEADTAIADAALATAAALATVDANVDAILLDTGTDGVILSATTQQAIADALLDRDMSLGTDSGSTTVRTVRQALRFLRNNWQVSGTTLTVYKEDDSTSSWTSTVTTNAAADPVTGSNPAGGA